MDPCAINPRKTTGTSNPVILSAIPTISVSGGDVLLIRLNILLLGINSQPAGIDLFAGASDKNCERELRPESEIESTRPIHKARFRLLDYRCVYSHLGLLTRTVGSNHRIRFHRANGTSTLYSITRHTHTETRELVEAGYKGFAGTMVHNSLVNYFSRFFMRTAQEQGKSISIML